MIKKLRVKFVCINMLIVTCMLILLFTTLFVYMHRGLVRDQLAAMTRAAEGPVLKHAPGKGGGDDARSPAIVLERARDGSLIAMGSGSYDLTDQEALETLWADTLAAGEQTGLLREYGLRYYVAETPFGQKLVFADTAVERATMQHLVKVCITIGLASFAGFFLLSLLLARWAIRPVEEAWRQQKQFVADASHELKTPLTVIMANAELLQQEEYSPEQKKQFSASILTMSGQMRHLLERLLDLARLDNVHETPSFDPLDFSQLVEESLLPFEPVFFEQGLTLQTRVDPGISVRGSEQLLRQVVDILLDNAQKYALPGEVRLRLQRSGTHACQLRLSNPAEELSRSECRDVFKRFYRRDEARTSSGSYGLGLPIAEGIVTRLGGRIVCDWADGEITFTVTLPAESA